jgi:hypothetical protein
MFFNSRNNLHNHGIYICWINKLYSAFSETHIEAQLSNFIIHKQKSVQNNGVRKATNKNFQQVNNRRSKQ